MDIEGTEERQADRSATEAARQFEYAAMGIQSDMLGPNVGGRLEPEGDQAPTQTAGEPETQPDA